MTLEEAKKVGEIIAEADGGCLDCVEALVKDLNRHFPEFTWKINDDRASCLDSERVQVIMASALSPSFSVRP